VAKEVIDTTDDGDCVQVCRVQVWACAWPCSSCSHRQEGTQKRINGTVLAAVRSRCTTMNH
jgi:hypothetical protein